MRPGFLQGPPPSNRLRPEELKARIRDLHAPGDGEKSKKPSPSSSSSFDDKNENASAAQGVRGGSTAERWEGFDLHAALHALNKQEEKQQPRKRVGDGENEVANELKDKGNASFQRGEYVQACEEYTQSINAQPTCIAYANRAMANIKLEKFPEAIDDATKALALDILYVKAYLRRGTAYKLLGQTEKALDDFEHALRLEPRNKKAIEGRESLIKQWAEEKGFGRALESGQRIPLKLVAEQGDDDRYHDSQPPPLLVPLKTKAITSETANLGSERLKDGGPEDTRVDPKKNTGLWDAAGLKAASDPNVKRQPPDHAVKIGNVNIGNVESQLSETIQRVERIPQNGVEFERVWKGLKGNSTSQATFLLHLQPNQLVNVLKQALTPTMLLELQLALLNDAVAMDAERTAALLAALPRVPRFQLNALSLSKPQKSTLSAAWDAVMEGPHRDVFLPLRKSVFSFE